jgi:hypothetical protein
MRWLTLLVPCLGVCVLIGCADAMAPKARTIREAEPADPQAAGEVAFHQDRPAQLSAKKGEDKKPGGQLNEPVKRKVIYTGNVELTVEKYGDAVGELKALVKNLKGYIAKADDNETAAGLRAGTYTIRVPAENFEQFMDDVGVLGQVRRRTSDSNDITDQYYDAQAHLKNDKIHEEGLQKLHEQKAEKGTLDEVLRLRDKLKEVRSQIDA